MDQKKAHTHSKHCLDERKKILGKQNQIKNTSEAKKENLFEK